MNSVTEALKTKAYVAPFAVFMGFTLVWQFGSPFLEWDHPAAPWWRRAPEQWLYPVQAIVCFALVFRWRKAIDWDWRETRRLGNPVRRAGYPVLAGPDHDSGPPARRRGCLAWSSLLALVPVSAGN